MKYVLLLLFFACALAQEPTHLVIDVEAEIAKAKKTNTFNAEDMRERILSAFEAEDLATLIYGDEALIIHNALPVTVSVAGDWGSYTVNCKVRLIFSRKRLGDEHYLVSGGGSSFDTAYEYHDSQKLITVSQFVDSPLGDQAAPFVSGDFFMNPECGFGPLSEPALTAPVRIRELNSLQEACVEAFADMGLGVFQPGALPPAACFHFWAVAKSYAEDITTPMMEAVNLQQCLLEAVSASGLSASCQQQLQQAEDIAKAQLGVCNLRDDTKASLRILNPDPHRFKAVYTVSFERSDCKRFKVKAFINATPQFFALEEVYPSEDPCLVVEPDNPIFYLVFNQHVQEASLKDVIRLRTARGGSQADVPIEVRQLDSGFIEIKPVATGGRLYPTARYWLELKGGEQGIKSESGETINEYLLYEDITDFFQVTSFYASPISKNPVFTMGKLKGAVYQVTRDARLLRNRPTATRLWYDWVVPQPSSPAEYMSSFCASFEVGVDGSEGSVYPPHEATILRQELYSDNDRHLAKDSVNLFNWRPDANAETLNLRVKPAVYWQGGEAEVEVPKLEQDHAVRFLEDAPAKLRIMYGYLAADEYAEGIPEGDRGVWQQQFLAARSYLWQMMPIESSTWHNVGAFVPEDLMTWRLFTDDKSFMASAAKTFSHQFCRGDKYKACILMVPPRLRNHQDVSSHTVGRGMYLSAAVLDVSKEHKDGLMFIGADGSPIVHEIGHSFGLSHVPLRIEGSEDYQLYLQEAGIFPNIDAVRMSRSGESGIFKSSTYGNPEAPAYLAPLMYPTIVGEAKQMIIDEHYDFLLRSIYGQGAFYGRSDDFPSSGDNNKRYGDMKFQGIRNFNGSYSYFGEGEDVVALVKTHELGFAEGDTHTGFILSLSMLATPGGFIPAAVAGPWSARKTPLDNYQANRGQTLVLRVYSQQGLLTEQVFTITSLETMQAESAERLNLIDPDKSVQFFQEIELFLALAADDLAKVSRLELLDAEANMLAELDISKLPQNITNLAYSAASGEAQLRWQSDGDSPVRIAFTPEGQDGDMPLGITPDVGMFVFSPDAVGITGAGTFSLTFDNGLVEKMVSLPAVVQSRFVLQFEQALGNPLTPELLLTFNRALGEVPDFSLGNQDEEIAVIAQLISPGDQLLLRPAQTLKPCQTYRLAALEPIKDSLGQSMVGKANWQLSTMDESCEVSTLPEATLRLTRNGQSQTFRGDAVRNHAGEMVLDVTELRVFLRFPAEEGSFRLAEIARGEERRDVILIYETSGGLEGQLELSLQDDILQGTFSANLGQQVLEGAFSLFE